MKAVAAAFAALALAVPAHAITITETVDFNSNLNTPTSVGTLDLGTNSISGSVFSQCTNSDNVDGSVLCVSTVGDEDDAVAFSIATGSELSAATLTLSNISGFGITTGIGRSFTDLLEAFGGITASQNILPSMQVTGTQNYEVSADLLFRSAAPGETLSFDWRLDLTTSRIKEPITPVPLPAGMALILTGLAGLGGLQMRKARKAKG